MCYASPGPCVYIDMHGLDSFMSPAQARVWMCTSFSFEVGQWRRAGLAGA